MTASLHDEVTRSIIREMESGVLPWERPWRSGGVIESARNAATGRCYTGVNTLLLWNAVSRHGYACNRWMTFRQARAAAGGVRRKERGTRIVFASRYLPREERARVESGAITAEQAATRFHIRAYHVFNLDQLRDPPRHLWPRPEAAAPPARCRRATSLADRAGAEIRHGGDDAFYHHGEDYIAMPAPGSFVEADDYASTLLHELTHWTGHASRLDRPFGRAPTDRAYIREELVAELGAAFLSAEIGIRPRARHSDYIACWLAELRADSRALFRAARRASEAAAWLRDGPAAAATGNQAGAPPASCSTAPGGATLAACHGSAPMSSTPPMAGRRPGCRWSCAPWTATRDSSPRARPTATGGIPSPRRGSATCRPDGTN